MAEKVVKAKIKKKRWYPILAPKLFGEEVLGESLVTDYALLRNKYITVNLMNITGEAKDQHVNIQFRVVKTQDGKGFADVVRYEMLPTSVRRFVRRGRDKISDSFTCRTSDKILVRVKPLFVTATLAKKSAQTGLRAVARKTLTEILSQSTFENAIKDLVQNKTQRHLRTVLNKIYPLKNCDIRVFEIEREKATIAQKKGEKEPEMVEQEGEKKEEAVDGEKKEAEVKEEEKGEAAEEDAEEEIAEPEEEAPKASKQVSKSQSKKKNKIKETESEELPIAEPISEVEAPEEVQEE